MTARKAEDSAAVDPRDSAVDPNQAPVDESSAAHAAPHGDPRHHKKAHKNVRMTRDPELYDPPHLADVHPDEVDNYQSGGWQVDGSDSATKG